MKIYHNISFFRHPYYWARNTYADGFSAGNRNFLLLVPLIFSAINFIASLATLGTVLKENISYVLLYMLFFYGIINMIIVLLITRISQKFKDEKSYYKVIHKNIVEPLREYNAIKQSKIRVGDGLKEAFIESTLRSVLKSFNDNYMKKRYSSKVVATIKYKKRGMLYPIREGDEINYRSNDAEIEEKSFVYKALNSFGQKLPYIYVKDLDNPDKYELKAMGNLTTDIKGRAADNYKTFIALPIRGGNIKFDGPGEVEAHPDLGVLGFDLVGKYKFGNFEDHELDYMACLADSIADLILDLLRIECVK